MTERLFNRTCEGGDPLIVTARNCNGRKGRDDGRGKETQSFVMGYGLSAPLFVIAVPLAILGAGVGTVLHPWTKCLDIDHGDNEDQSSPVRFGMYRSLCRCFSLTDKPQQYRDSPLTDRLAPGLLFLERYRPA